MPRRGQQVKFGKFDFSTKTKFFAFMANYLKTHDVIDESDMSSFVELMSRHHRGFNSTDKLIISRNPETFYSKCFAVEHSDGSVDYRSYKSIVNGSNIIHKFRLAIKEQIDDYASNAGLECEKCHSMIDDGKFNVHHIITFKQLLNEFLDEEKINLDKINEDELDEILKKWPNYHKKHAQLICLCLGCHHETHYSSDSE